MTVLAFRSSLLLGLLTAGALCVACSASSGGDDSAATSGGTAGAAVVNHGGSGGTSAAVGKGGMSSGQAGSSSPGTGAGGSIASGGGGSGNLGTAGSPAMGGSQNTAGTGGSTATGGSSGGGATQPSGKTEFAPYYEIGVDTGAFSNLVDMKTKSGVSDVTLAFVLSGKNGCGTDNTVSGYMSEIKAFVAAGGHVKASFGGAAGKYVEAGCTDAASLASAIEKFVDDTQITDLDFDIEQGPVETQAANQMRGQALKMVQDAKQAKISFTLQTDESGLDKGARSVVTEAVKAGVSIYHVNLMVMDYGDMPDGTAIAPIAIKSLNGANTQLKAIITGLTTEQAWAMLGATPDIGQNDDNEVFSLKDQQDLADFAKQNKLGLLTFWNIQRDQTCGKGECSGFNKANFDYAKIFLAAAQ